MKCFELTHLLLFNNKHIYGINGLALDPHNLRTRRGPAALLSLIALALFTTP